MYGVHATQIGSWKKKALEELAQVFTSRRSSAVREQEDLTSTLYQQIGRLKVELDWLAFEELVRTLRKTEEWRYVDREIDIRLIREPKAA